MLTNQIARIKAALNAVEFPDAQTLAETAQEWVELFSYPESDNPNIRPLEVAFSVPSASFSVIARNDRPVLAKQLAKLMAANKYPEVETKLLQLGFKELPTAFLSCEVEMQGKERDVRWAASEVMPISAALKILPDGELETKLQAWYKEVDSDACLSIGRSVGGGYTTWETELPGDNIGAALKEYMYLCRDLGAEELPLPLIEALDGANPEQITVFGHFTKNGATRMGLSINEPSEEVIQIAVLAASRGDNGPMDAIAAFEGSLGKRQPTKINFYLSARGFDTQFFYYL